MPRIPDRARHLRPRRAALHLRHPLRLRRALPGGQVQHSQAVLAAHRPRRLEPIRHAHPRGPRGRRVAPSEPHAPQADGTPPLCPQDVALPL